jgi:hypothetical protein
LKKNSKVVYYFKGGALGMYLIVTFGTCMKYAKNIYHFKELFDINDLE